MTTLSSLILNVDDNDGARYAKTRLLQVAGFDVIEAANGADALTLARQRMPDLVLLDVKLPDINGLEVCRRIKSDPATSTILVLQTSAALTGQADKVKGLDGGADNYLAAPIGGDELVANVNALLRLRRIQADLKESEERFRQMAENIHDVFWIFSLADHKLLYVSPAYDTIWGKSVASLDAQPDDWIEAVHPEDSARVRDAFHQIFQNHHYDQEYRLILPDGAIRWVRDRAFPVKDGLDQVYRLARITSDISAAKQAEISLKEADVHKNQFLAMLAHELRSPLGPIRNAVQVLRKIDSPASREDVFVHDVISRQVDHMTRLVDDLLDIARISKGKISLRLAPVSLRNLFDSAIETSMPFIQQRHHTLDTDLPGDDIWMMGDAVRLAQVLSNLLHNAAKYTAGGGKINLSAKLIDDAKCVHISVKDNGIGISAERAQTIFTLFAQGEAAPDLAQNGLGIGLSLVKQLIELHGGGVTVNSQGPGFGSTFTLSLPVVDQIAMTDDSSTAERARGQTKIILIVDDNIDSAETTAMLLGTYGYTTYLASDAASTLAAARRHMPDIILLDIGLPGINGYEVARQLRAEADFATTRLIAITGYGSDRDRELALAAGFDHHVVKPAEIDKLLEIIEA